MNSINFSQLPEDIVRQIFKWTNPQSAFALSQTAQALHHIYQDTIMQKELLKIHYNYEYSEAVDKSIPPGKQYQYLRDTKFRTSLCLKTETCNKDKIIIYLSINSDKTKSFSISLFKELIISNLTTDLRQSIIRYRDLIQCFQVSADETRVLLGAANGTLKLWDLTAVRHLKTLNGHQQNVSCVQISADGTKGLSGSHDKTLKIWNLTTNECVKTLVGHQCGISCVQISKDWTKVLSGSWDSTLRFWNLETDACLVIPTGHQNNGVSCLQLSADETTALSGSFDHSLKLWDLKKGECLQTLIGHQSEITCLQLSADGTKALSGSEDGTLKLWDLKKGECLQTLCEHQHSILCLQLSPDGTKAISGSADALKFWDFTPPLAKVVGQIAQKFFEQDPSAQKQFENLPFFIQQDINDKVQFCLETDDIQRVKCLRKYCGEYNDYN